MPPNPIPMRQFLLVLLLLSASTLLLYWPALHAPWYLDDMASIVYNPQLHDLSTNLRGVFGRRGLAMLSFAINYRLGGLETFGYHLVSLALHLVCALLVFLLLRRVWRDGIELPVLGALLFLIHPLQTQTVNYLVQRMTLLSAAFFLLALYLFVRSRERLASGSPWLTPKVAGCYVGALAAGALALLSKEIAAVLPLALLLFSRYFLPEERRWRPLLRAVAPFCLAPLLVAALFLLLPLLGGQSLVELTSVDHITSQSQITPLTYLVTEFSVLWIYLKLMFFPYGQALDHSYPLVTQLLTLRNTAAFAGLLGLGWLAWQLRRRLPLLSFGIAWFFLTLAVESTILPLDPLFEHRLYLPLFGIIVASLGLLQRLPPRLTVTIGGVILFLLALLSWQRNHLWADAEALHRDNLRLVPHSERVLVNLALQLMLKGQTIEAEDLLRQATRINPRHEVSFINLSKLLAEQQRYDETMVILQQGLKANPDSVRLLNNLGTLYRLQHDPDRAIATLTRALAISPQYEPALTNLGAVYGSLGLWSEAERYQRRAIATLVDDPVAYYNLGLALENQGRPTEAVASYQNALQRNPNYSDALLHLGLVNLRLGARPEAEQLLPLLQKLDQGKAARLAQALTR
jgi:protein O-mannosyl-transferase